MSESPLDHYLWRHGIACTDRLGEGKDGVVHKTSRASALKVVRREDVYRRELRAYRLFRELSIGRIGKYKVPRLIDSDDSGLLLELTIVSAPYFLDFASTYDELEMFHLDFSEEVWAEREQHWRELFGEDWEAVRGARDKLLELTGLMYLDLTPKNIRSR